MKKNIAHIITLTSLCIGILSIIESCKFNFITSSYLIFLSLLLDILDGTIARYLNSVSKLGKQLDSFSDMIAFGIAPGILIYNFFIYQFDNQSLAYISLLLPICSSLRLAKYNINSSKNDVFSGLTTPVNAILFSALPLISVYEKNEKIWNLIINEATITSLIIIMSILLICLKSTVAIKLLLISLVICSESICFIYDLPSPPKLCLYISIFIFVISKSVIFIPL